MCTCVRMTATDGAVVVGRTQEFGAPLGTRIAMLPRGYAGTSSGPDGPGLSWTATFGVVGADTYGQIQTLQDGINEQGLYAGLLYLPGFTEYAAPQGHEPASLLSPMDLVAYVLGTCADVAAVKVALRKVVVWPAKLEKWGFCPPLHLVLHDASGASVVIEWQRGSAIEFDNPIGVTTNAPLMEWHYTNLRNYVDLQARNPEGFTISGVEIAPLGQGAGMRGLPGDTSPPSRFVRAAAFVASHAPVSDGQQLEIEMLHLMNNFDIPRGSVVSADGSHTEETRFTAVANLAARHYIVRSYDDPTPRRIDLATIDLASKLPRQVDLPAAGFLDLTV